MTLDLSKPKRHPLPRLWMQITDKLRLAKPFLFRLELDLDQVLELLLSMEDIKKVKKREVWYRVFITSHSDYFEFEIRQLNTWTTEESNFIEGKAFEEENIRIVTITGKAYPSPIGYIAFVVTLIIIPLFIFSGAKIGACVTILVLVYPIIAALVIPSFVGRNELLEVFTQHLQTIAAERARQE